VKWIAHILNTRALVSFWLHLDNHCRDAEKIVHGPAAEIEQTGPRDDRVQSWPHPRVGLDSEALKGAGPAGCGSDELTDPALLHFEQCARKHPPIEMAPDRSSATVLATGLLATQLVSVVVRLMGGRLCHCLFAGAFFLIGWRFSFSWWMCARCPSPSKIMMSSAGSLMAQTDIPS